MVEKGYVGRGGEGGAGLSASGSADGRAKWGLTQIPTQPQHTHLRTLRVGLHFGDHLVPLVLEIVNNLLPLCTRGWARRSRWRRRRGRGGLPLRLAEKRTHIQRTVTKW
jgi:hypothetical protein